MKLDWAGAKGPLDNKELHKIFGAIEKEYFHEDANLTQNGKLEETYITLLMNWVEKLEEKSGFFKDLKRPTSKQGNQWI